MNYIFSLNRLEMELIKIDDTLIRKLSNLQNTYMILNKIIYVYGFLLYTAGQSKYRKNN